DDIEQGIAVDTESVPDKKVDVCPDGDATDKSLAKLHVEDAAVQKLIHDLVERHVAVTSTLPVFEQFVPGKPKVQARVLNALSLEAKSDFLQRRVNVSTGPSENSYAPISEVEKRFELAC